MSLGVSPCVQHQENKTTDNFKTDYCPETVLIKSFHCLYSKDWLNYFLVIPSNSIIKQIICGLQGKSVSFTSGQQKQTWKMQVEKESKSVGLGKEDAMN